MKKKPKAILAVVSSMAALSAGAQTEDIYVPDSVLAEDVYVSDTIAEEEIASEASASDAYQVEIPYFQNMSPEATAFKRHGDYDVNEYTGSPNISVPLYTLHYKDIDIPLTLTYDASGIRVDQEASWVGLGWNLMVGGCINYVAAGDVDPRTLYATNANWETFASQGTGEINTFFSNLVKANNGQYTIDEPIRDDLMHGYGETDYFSVNLLGQTFLFIYDRSTSQYRIVGNGEGVYKIEDEGNCSYANIDNARWKITDGNGVQYYFIPGEKTNGTSFQSIYTSTWYLSEIVTPEGSLVEFGYGSTTYVPWRVRLYEQCDFVISATPIAVGVGSAVMVNYPGQGYNSALTASTYNVHTRYPSSIKTTAETITFTLEGRTDLTNAQRLKRISVKSNVSGKTVREFNFNYSYFTASTIGGDMPNNRRGSFSYDPDLGQRLKLTSLEESAGSTTLTTNFVYNESMSLPLKTSAATDFWGYFNHVENYVGNKLTLLPTPKYLLSSNDDFSNEAVKLYTGANRYCSPAAMQAAILQKIVYPTKGYTKFEYEPHQFLSTVKYPTAAYFSSNQFTTSIYDGGSSTTNYPQNHYQLNLSGQGKGSITVKFTGSLSNLYSNGAYVRITPMNPNIGSTITYDLSLASSSQIAFDTSFSKTILVSLPANSYMVTASCPKLGSSYSVSATLNIAQLPDDSSVPVNTGGGLRIKSVANYNHDGTLADSTAYLYTNANGQCSGKLLQPMLHYDKKEIKRIVQSDDGSGTNGITAFTVLRLKQNSSAVPAFFSTLSRGTVGYSTVTRENYGADRTLAGTVISTFTNTAPTSYFSKFYYPATDNGNLTSQTTKDTDGTLLQKVENSYAQTTSNFGHILFMEDRLIYERSALYAATDFYRYRFWHFPFRYRWGRLSQSTVTTYDGSKTQTATTTYTYNTTNHRVKTETASSSIPGVSYVTEYKYPSDFTSVPACSLMCNNTYHMLNPVIEQSLSVVENGTTTLIKKRRETYTSYTDKYRDAGYSNRVFLPTATSFVTNGGSQELRLSYTYNNKCDRTGIIKDTEKVAYLWAYNNMYPVAEIRGATYSQVSGWVGATTLTALAANTSSTSVASALASIRSTLAAQGVLMTSYTYDPLIGITAITAPNGTTTTYTYDGFGRLSTVKNHNGTTLQNHSYNYKND